MAIHPQTEHGIRRRLYALGLLSLAFLWTSPIRAGEDAAMAPPETEIAKALGDLAHIRLELDGSRDIAGRTGLGPQTDAAKAALARAKAYLEVKEYRSAQREAESYNRLVQVPDVKEHLAAELIIGRASAKLGEERKSLDAYQRYLAAFLTDPTPDYQELLGVLRELTAVAAKPTVADANQVGQLLAAIISVDLPQNVAPDILYVAAKAAVASGRQDLGSVWFGRVAAMKTSADLRSRALYLKSLIQIQAKDYDGARDTLSQALDVADSDETRDLACLALARIAVHRREPAIAMKYYRQIAKKSPLFQDALFESVYVDLDLGHDDDARDKALSFLEVFPDGADSFRLRSLLSYLDLRAGKLAEAKSGIEHGAKDLNGMSRWLRIHLEGQSRLNEADLKELVARTKDYVEPPRAVNDALALFARLETARQNLVESRGTIQNAVFTLGRMRLLGARPIWQHRAEQLARIADQALAVGHRLSAVERRLYKARLSPSLQQKLEASEARRNRLLSASAVMVRNHEGWSTWANLASLTNDLAAQYERLQTLEAQVTAGRYLTMKAAQPDVEDLLAKNREEKLRQLDHGIARLRTTLAAELETLRERRVQALVEQSPHRTAYLLLSAYAAALHDESQVLAGARDEASSPAERMLAEDAGKAWKQWDFICQQITTQMKELDDSISADLSGTLKTLDDESARYEALKAKERDLNQATQVQLGRALSVVLPQYQNAIQQRLATYEKWKADLAWLGYVNTAKRKDEGQRRFDLEHQILEDNLKDLQRNDQRGLR